MSANLPDDKRPVVVTQASEDGLLKWVVEFEVDEKWVEDGFNLTDAEALAMLAKRLGYANMSSELDATVIGAPSDAVLKKLQGW